MTTFKNSAKYAELLFVYLEMAEREDNPFRVTDVLRIMPWMFKGGSLQDAAEGTRLKPETSEDFFPQGLSSDISWPNSKEARALRLVLARRSSLKRKRAREAVIGTWLFLTASYGVLEEDIVIYTGMRSVYWAFGGLWEAAEKQDPQYVEMWELLGKFGMEMAMGTSVVSRMDPPTVAQKTREYWNSLTNTRVAGLLKTILDLKELMRTMGGKRVREQARRMGREASEEWEDLVFQDEIKRLPMPDLGEEVLYVSMPLGPFTVRVSQEVVLLNRGLVRYALSKSDLERLHQLTMSAASCLVGVCAQAVVGTTLQVKLGLKALEVTEANIQRIVDSSRRVALGDEVLVCKGYRRAYTAHLAVLAGHLCMKERLELAEEARGTAPPGVLDIDGFLEDVGKLDAASSLNAGKVFKICPAPDVSPGAAMIDRIKQIGNCNIFLPEMEEEFTVELRDQILRAYIRKGRGKGRLKLRNPSVIPAWWEHYLKKNMSKVPTAEIHEFLEWEGTAEMPVISPYDASNWKDSGLGADTLAEGREQARLGSKRNMITRLLFDDDCPMPGKEKLSEEHVIKFFVKAEGHKDPARGIFSANLTDRQAQSWMEKAVEKVAVNHPSFMIGASSDLKEVKIRQLTSRPKMVDWVALYYSFDISGWSAKMPAEPQRISHKIWSTLYGGHLFDRATEINEGSIIYVNLEGYYGWYRNTAANLEGFNGKEMTMILVALLSLSVRVWRKKVVEANLLSEDEASKTTALLFAYIDDGLSRIDLPREKAVDAFNCYKECVIETFNKCGFSVETSKCFPSDRFAIFLNEVYLSGRHVVHGVRAAMGISSEPTERHTSLVERVTSVATGCRGAVMAGLSTLSAVYLMSYHALLHIIEWTTERDPVILSVWSLSPRTWGGLGMPNMLQMSVSGSGAAFEEGVATMQKYALVNKTARRYFINMCKTELKERSPASVLTAPLSGRVSEGYMIDSRLGGMVRESLKSKMEEGRVSSYAERLLRYGDIRGFQDFAEAVVHVGEKEVIQEQMLTNVMEAHPHSIFSAFAARVEKSVTVSRILGQSAFLKLMEDNRSEASASARCVREVLARVENKTT